MKNKNIIRAIVLNIIITLSEVIVGVFSGSLAVVSDAAHNFMDVGAMILSLFGEKISEKDISPTKSYGYKRAEILIALLNSSILLVSIVFIAIAAIERLFHPEPIAAGWMLAVAVIAFAGNLAATRMLHGHKDTNLNMKSAFLHSLQDTLFSAGVIVAALFIFVFHWTIIDGLVSLVLSIILAKEVIVLLNETVSILMEGVPASINLSSLRHELASIPHVTSVEDLHVWQTGSQDIMMTAHVGSDLKNEVDYTLILKTIKTDVCNRFGITHSTIQLVPIGAAAQLESVCKHCS